MTRGAAFAVGVTAPFLLLIGCATQPFLIPDEASAVSAACNWGGNFHYPQTNPEPRNSCAFTSASLKGNVWYVREPVNCDAEGLQRKLQRLTVCVGGDTYIWIDRRTGRVVRLFVGE
jgi:hypothetical protein